MRGIGIRPRDVLALARETQRAHPTRPVLVVGELAAQLARELAEGGDTGLVRTIGPANEASVIVVVCAGLPRPDDLALLRAATRADVPLIAVQLDRSSARVPYVQPQDVVDVPAGAGFPVDEIWRRVAARVGDDDARGLSAGLPRFRSHARQRRVVASAVTCGVLAALRPGNRSVLPLLSLAQARMLRDLDKTGPTTPPSDLGASVKAVAPELAVSVAVGVGARSLARALPMRNRGSDAVIAATATACLGLLAARVR